MAYYYRSHIRNLEEQALLEKQKIAAELHQKQLLSQSQFQSFNQLTPTKLRQIQDRQTAAYLERSRLSAELSAMRIKAQNSMNRSRLQSAFQLRKQNQKTMQQLSQMDRKHALMLNQGIRQEQEAQINWLCSQRRVQQAVQEENRVYHMLNTADIEYQRELTSAYRLQSLMRERYGYPY